MLDEMLHYYEHLSVRPRQLWWMLAVGIAVVVAGSIVLLPFVIVAWSYSLLRFHRSDIRIDEQFVSVGTKRMPLIWLDPATLGQPRNVWPWFWLSSRRLTCVPFWTSAGVGIRGKDHRGKRVFVSLGTNHRDELIAALLTGIARARVTPAAASDYGSPTHHGAPSGPAGWFPDPWDPVRGLRWFDGHTWTGWTSPHPDRTATAQRWTA
jgi:hypothetical protein